MADGMHAVVFVDNHDNQRGHGGGGGVITASNQIGGNPAEHNDWQYKVGLATGNNNKYDQVATAFMLGHDYGFKRLMSSYYFSDTDQGPPGGAPASYPNICGNGWTCEHRWSPIMNMVQYANKVQGQPVSNWQVRSNSYHLLLLPPTSSYLINHCRLLEPASALAVVTWVSLLSVIWARTSTLGFRSE